MTTITVSDADVLALGGALPRGGFLQLWRVTSVEGRLDYAREVEVSLKGNVSVTFDPTGSLAYKLAPRAMPGVYESWTVAVPSSGSFALSALVEEHSLDPASLVPLDPFPPSAAEVLAQAGQARDDAQAVAAGLPAAAEVAIAAEAESQLAPLVADAAGQANSAAASKVQAETSAASAGTAAFNAGSAAASAQGAANDADAAREAAVAAQAAAEAVPASNDGIVAALLGDKSKQSRTAAAELVNDRVFGGTRKDIRDYGAKMDGIILTDAVTVAGQPTVSAASRAFTPADVGKTIAVMGAGPVIANANDGVWISTIVSVAGGVATLASNATSTGTGMRCIFGTPDDAAFAAAQTAAAATNGIGFGMSGGTVYIPPGRTIVTVPLIVKSLVSWKGEGREVSWVHSIQDRPGSPIAAGQCDWLTCAGRNETNPLVGADFSDFGIEAEAHIHTGGYGSAVKPLNIYYVQRCSITRMHVRNFPATAIPFDHSYDQVSITDNYIYRPGRLAPSGVGPGGSGIGAGTKGTGATEPTLIANNIIVGTQSSTVSSPGQNGIFTEAQTGANPGLGVQGYRIINNVIIGMFYGISDAGSTGTLIQGNTIVGCSRGIALRKTTLSAAYPGLNAIIVDNTIRGGVGPAATDGVGILIALPQSVGDNVRGNIQPIVRGNQIIDNQSWGIHVTVPSGGGVDTSGVMIHDNMIARNGRSGIRLSTTGGLKLMYPAVHHNQIVNNGKSGFGGDTAGILIASGTIIEGGRIQDNDIYDLGATKAQTINVVSIGATLTAVTVTGNTPEPTPPAPNLAEYVDLTTSAAGTILNKPLPDGALTNKTWSIRDTGTGGVLSYTGTSIIATAGTSRVFGYVDLSSESVSAPKWFYGIAKAKVATLAASGTNRHVTVAANVGTDGSGMYFGPRYSGGTWKYRFARRAPGGSSDVDLFDIAATPAVGDVIGISMDGSNVTCYVNGVAVYTLPWDLYHTARWGVMFAPDQDKISSLKEWSYNSSIIV